jgi:hypothetical protein
MQRKLLYTLMFGSVMILTACGGGGGGGGGGSGGSPYTPPNPYLRTQVPFATPTRVAVVTPLVGQTTDAAISEQFSANIENNGGQNIIIAGRETQPSTTPTWNESRISMLGWSNGQLVDKTAQWFPNDSNKILGTDPTLQFADFFGSGRTDMFVASSTDMNHYGPAHVFENTGSSFNRIDITLPGWVGRGDTGFVYSANTNRVWGHGATVVDLNKDGHKDFLIADYGPNLTIGINRMGEATPVKNFKTYVAADPYNGITASGSSIAVADFLGNGQNQIVVTDTWCGTPNCTTNPTRMFSYSINSNDQLSFTLLSTLPTPRFELPKWSGYNFGGSHNILALTFNMATGLPNTGNDLLIFSRPSTGPGRYSEIQFLKNNGTGTFSDITDSTLIGFNTHTQTTYNPKFIDINGDGLTDILVSGNDYSGQAASSQFLLRSSDGKYVATHQNLLTDFKNQVAQMDGSGTSNNINLVRDANGQLYLVSLTSYVEGGTTKQGVYISALGSANVTTAQTAINLIKQTWPYMTNVQANQALAMTSATYMTEAGEARVIDFNRLMNPVGALGLADPNRAGSVRPIGGFLSGIQLDNHSAVAMDSIGRSYNVDLKTLTGNVPNAFQYANQTIDSHSITSHAEYLVGGSAVTTNGVRIGSDARNLAGSDNTNNIGALGKPAQYTVGIPSIYRSGNLSYGMQYTSLNSHPWLAMSGSWGTVNNTGILDNVVSYQRNGFTATGSLMNVSTNITPGLVTNVSNITGYWGETGYRYTNMDKGGIGDLGFYVGVRPVVMSGSAQVTMPTGVDANGNTQYTNRNYNIAGDITPYIRSVYNYPIHKNTLYRLTGMAMPNGQYRIMNEVRWFLP